MVTGGDEGTAAARRTRYAVTAVGLGVIAAATVAFARWETTADLHLFFEVVATMLALVVAAMTLVRYYSSPEPMLLFVGAGFGGTAVLEGVHTFAASVGTIDWFPLPFQSIPWSWLPPRIFLPGMLILAWWVARSNGQRRFASEGSVYRAIGLLALAVFVLFLVVPLPRATYPDLLTPRPQDLLSALLFVGALVAHLRLGRWRTDVFAHWLVLSLILAIATQITMAFSGVTFDAAFDVGHVLKIGSYGGVLVGALASAFGLFKESEGARAAAVQANDELRVQIAERERLAGELDLLERVATAANAATTSEEALRTAVEAVCEYVGWPVGHAYLVERNGGPPRLVGVDVWVGGDVGFRAATSDFDPSLPSTLPGRVLRSGRPAWIGDVTTGAEFVRVGEAKDEGLRAAFAFPVLVGREVVAVLEFFGPGLREPNKEILALVARVGERLGRAVERDHARTAIEESEQRLFRFLEHLPVGVFIIDQDGHPYYGNRMSNELLGRGIDPSASDLSETYGIFRVDTGERCPSEELPAVRALHGEIVRTDNLVVHRPDGTTVPLEVWAEPIRDGRGRITHAVAAFSDISERKRAEEEIERHAQELARSNAELEQFAYIASHDLQEPLRMVTGYVQLLARRYADNLDGDGREFIDYAVDGAERMRALINDLLAYSRVERKGNPPVPTDAEQAYEAAVRNLEAAIAERGAVVERGPLPTVNVDPGQLVQVFQNLIGNGIKFSDKSSPEVHVSAEQDQEMWRFAVRDNGIGIEQTYMERIFTVFQRLHTREEYSGTGIGLAICKKIVERHGGSIWVESEPGEGSTFFFTLPAVDERVLLELEEEAS